MQSMHSVRCCTHKWRDGDQEKVVGTAHHVLNRPPALWKKHQGRGPSTAPAVAARQCSNKSKRENTMEKRNCGSLSEVLEQSRQEGIAQAGSP